MSLKVGSMLAVIVAVLLSSSLTEGAVAKPTGQPTSQPTGVPTSYPTSLPTAIYRPLISLNVTLLLHEVNPTTFNSKFGTCVYSIQKTLSQALGIRQNGVVINQQSVELYENEVYDYNYMDTKPNPFADESTEELYNFLAPAPRRRLSRTHGSRGITVDMTLNADPNRMGFAEDNDKAYFAIVNELKDTIRSHALTGFMRDQSYMSGCWSLASMEGISPRFISSDYLSVVLNEASPTPSPTVHIVEQMQNRAGVIAGVLLGVTAFLLAVFAALHFNIPVPLFFGGSLEIDRQSDNIQVVAVASEEANQAPSSV